MTDLAKSRIRTTHTDHIAMLDNILAVLTLLLSGAGERTP